MGKSSADDAIIFLSKLLYKNRGVVRISFKKGGVYQKQHAKIHSRKAKKQLHYYLKIAAYADQTKLWPLTVRVKGAASEEKKKEHLSCRTQPGRSQDLTTSLLNFLRLAYYEDAQNNQKAPKEISKANPASRTSLRKIKRTERNRQRKKELKKRQKEAKRNKQRDQRRAQPPVAPTPPTMVIEA